MDFFKKKKHVVIDSAPMIPEHDPTALFISAGMHPLVPYLMGEKHPSGKKLTNFQKCVRTGDIEEVGDETHLTFFEMLGNWSLGDYYKREAIKWSFEFLTSVLKISSDKLFVTCFEGDDDILKDQESAKIWEEVGLRHDHIFFLGKKDNFWGPVGNVGPCGPDTEMFYYTSKKEWNKKSKPGSSDDFVEIWNDVFMGYEKKIKIQNSKVKSTIQKSKVDYEYIELSQKNIDTGMGLERTVAILNGFSDVYRIDTLWPLVLTVMKVLNVKEEKFEKYYLDHHESIRVIVDHLRAATFILGDQRGVVPSNLDQGYVLRRLVRRAIRHGRKLGVPKDVCLSTYLAKEVVDLMGETYPELLENRGKIINELYAEEKKFEMTLERGLKQFEKIEKVTGEEAFKLFSTYGFPLELTVELAKEKGIDINKKDFEREFKKHQDLSRKGAKKRFKGGLADDSEISRKYHTATHLLHKALKELLGDHVSQKGSNITAERLRFDFSHPKKLTDQEKKKVEEIVNSKIKEALPVKIEEMTVKEAKEKGAIGLFESKYGDQVKVYSVGDYSKEICGGPHVKNTKELGTFKIKKEESSSAGIRRIKAVLE